jgi:hypothetical protein
LLIDPALDGVIALPFDGFPIYRINESVLIVCGEQIAIPDLSGSPCVPLVVEAEKCLPYHVESSSKKKRYCKMSSKQATVEQQQGSRYCTAI